MNMINGHKGLMEGGMMAEIGEGGFLDNNNNSSNNNSNNYNNINNNNSNTEIREMGVQGTPTKTSTLWLPRGLVDATSELRDAETTMV